MTVAKTKNKISRTNAAFARMTDAEKRVAIARDAIAQIIKKKYILTIQTYCSVQKCAGNNVFTKKHRDYRTSVVLPKNTELRTVLKSIPECEVCARGALFLSAIRKFNNFQIGGGGVFEESIDFREPRVMKYEREFFSSQQLSLIETAFESDLYGFYVHHGIAPQKMLNAACAFGWEYNDATTRLLAILENIIENNGEFIIPKEYFTLAKQQ